MNTLIYIVVAALVLVGLVVKKVSSEISPDVSDLLDEDKKDEKEHGKGPKK